MEARRDSELDDRWAPVADEAEGGFEIPPFLLDPLGVAKRRWIWMLAGTLLGLVGTAVAVASWKPSYSATATVLITSQSIPEDFVRSTVREDSFAYINAMVGQVVSVRNLSRVIEQYELYPELRDRRSINDIVSVMRGAIEVEPTQDAPRGKYTASMVYGISFEGKDAFQVADVANALAALFVEASIARRNNQAQRTTRFLRQALERDERELREHSRKLSEFRREHRGELPDERETNLRKLEILSDRRQSVSDQILVKENRIASLTANPGGRAETENEVLLDELRRQLARETAANTDEHPNVVSLRRRVARLEEVVDAERSEASEPSREVQAALANERFELERLRRQLADIATETQEIDARIDRTPAVAEELVGLEQKESVLRDNYLVSLRKVEEAELAESLESAQQGTQVSILDRAQPPSSPAKPRWLYLAGGLSVTLALALGVAVFFELIDPVVLSSTQLEKIAERPALGVMPRIA
jgi:succinoglycan biosynthesis transport protein ExoP